MKKILIIEEEQTIREELSLILSMAGFLVFEAGSGLKGLQLIEKESPDVILCDTFMQSFDVFDILKPLRESKSTNKIPFIFLATIKEKGHLKLLCFSAVGYDPEPFEPDILINFIQEISITERVSILK